MVGVELSKVAASLALAYSAEAGVDSRSSRALTTFQWGGTISALFLLLLNRTGRRSHTHTSLLVVFLFITFPSVLFKILRGQFGYWVACLAVLAHLFFPEDCQVSRFVLFVITPNWVAEGLRDSIVGGVFCLVIAIALVVTWIQGIGGFDNCICSGNCFFYFLGIALLTFFTIWYLCLGL